MKKRIRKAARKLRAGRVLSAVRALLVPHHTETRILTARQTVADFLRTKHGNAVAHGPFKGMALPDRSYWGNLDISAKILGTYEHQIATALTSLSVPDGLLVDLGSADGYFAIGAMRAGLFQSCICFEQSEKGRTLLQDTAIANEVDMQITIHGTATEKSLLDLVPDPRPGVVLCDIEGGEFDVLTDRVLRHFAGMHLLVELHGFLVENGPKQTEELRNRASAHFTVEVLRSTLPDIHVFPELDQFDDDHRLLAFSEGRDGAMEWLLLRPKRAV